METKEAIFKRRSCREYTQQEVSTEQLKILLNSAFSAPTAVNAQPWEFVVINEKSVLDKLREKLRYARYNAPAAVVVCGNSDLGLKGQDKDLWVCDCSAAIENMLLTATDMGLGSLWVGIYPIKSRMQMVRTVLDMPENVNPLGMVYVGYAAKAQEGRCRYNEKAVYWQKYDKSRKHRKKNKPVIGHYA
ncbi:MAG: nitroreductase family protein [Oscillospiraceae bacterium]|nr:nitroreductase family protein [Oscillospiraceae bacterium]